MLLEVTPLLKSNDFNMTLSLDIIVIKILLPLQTKPKIKYKPASDFVAPSPYILYTWYNVIEAEEGGHVITREMERVGSS